MSLRRCLLLSLCLACCSAPALALSLEFAGSPNPEDLVCPRFISAAAPAPTAAPPQEELTAPLLEEVEDVLELPEQHPAQRIRLSQGHRAGAPAIGFWGDSHLAAAFFTDEMLLALGLAKDEVKPGFLPPTMGRAGVRLPLRKHCKSPGWRFANAYAARGESLKVGPALTVLENSKDDAALWVDFRYPDARPALTQLTVQFREIEEQPVVLEIEVDDNPARQLTLEKGENQLQLNGSPAFSQLKLRVLSGTLALEGFAPVYQAPARLRLDLFGIPGATARSWKIADPLYLRSRLSDPEYDLVILEYGTNEGADRHFDPESYQSGLAASLRGLRSSFPQAQCLLIGPTDRGVLVKKSARAEKGKKHAGKAAHGSSRKAVASRGELLKYARIHARIAEIQKTLAQAHGCGFWDWQLAMGGPGGAYKWFFQSPPRMARDLIHLTRGGYQESARLFVADTGIGEWLK